MAKHAQLKFHLGLDVPVRPNGEACAHLKVGTERRTWANGEVLFFDDSFEHEVHNDCGRERVVFQAVFVHPELMAKLTFAEAKRAVFGSSALPL